MKLICTVKDIVQDHCYLARIATAAVIVISRQELKMDTAYLFMNPTLKAEKIYDSNPKFKPIMHKSKEAKQMPIS